ncbi:MAG: type II toxin-antitoxin system PemK/MazF family toxin [Lewinellaceae bacterium]|nr:type II toxin-antitoxin system PemK/MazF family toxin [Lewinellaceae bacterium]
MAYEQWDVAIVPFPFVNSLKSKPRPVLVLSNASFNLQTGHYIAAMITSSSQNPWAGDTEIKNIEEAGLNKPSLVRLKLFTMDERIVKRKIGRLSNNDVVNVRSSMNSHISI